MKQLQFNFVLKALETVKQVLKPLKEVVKQAVKKFKIRMGEPLRHGGQWVIVEQDGIEHTRIVSDTKLFLLSQNDLVKYVMECK
ncbi:hypothetical protein [Endozoicomonas euniceicola]|uniref:Uncharacterized protein n=1 Tax=Endozoicomonas euniceicola TaxID=1234143 RepID=A0ABY6GMU3_9GAMM|nr:hypothetical protein [Endozoicomonas euniceicola]UYM14043.1 hypothetical protein NX720_14100 [Endozoicomonas euniceicola]